MSPPTAEEDSDSETELGRQDGDDDVGDGEALGEEEEEELDDDEGLASPNHNDNPQPNIDPPPSYLREVSTLASWTVSSSKPGCSIPQLRHPSTNLFWQSDGPQPHYLNIHFFKLVRIVGLRLYLDFEQDESYTPTKIIFLAGSGMNDLQEWGEMRLESPRGWIWADFSGVGDADSEDDDGGDDDESDEDDDGEQRRQEPLRITAAPTNTNGRQRGANEAASSDSENAAPQDTEIETPVQNQHHTPMPANDEDLGRSGQEHGMRGDMKAVTGVSTPSVHLATGKEAVVRKLKEERLELGRSAWDMEGCIR
ncbi:anaphase-promoting complex subunit 10 [Pyrenophora tritici-repentis Pt-1C-BFP]|uniref:Anaphase-promoting complex subunit 10 n=1 Tax=Pyrenophora tritici-repentis (strain Pt-1C-BFP) TaxID=426418 RepID=B2WJI4_PYRTR|nr:anaphase-promoting complex subunit 10 [Pyrenophora tritici-repentis Pt-1C-BFP]EDU43381.1 anaphase-promoting complex subunit 10 [Pyrenophora tritici-repentis Pt-1C-BFP]